MNEYLVIRSHMEDTPTRLRGPLPRVGDTMHLGGSQLLVVRSVTHKLAYQEMTSDREANQMIPIVYLEKE